MNTQAEKKDAVDLVKAESKYGGYVTKENPVVSAQFAMKLAIQIDELNNQLAEARRDAGHLWNALKDLSFDCDGVTQTQAPTRGTYNGTFMVCKALEKKYETSEHYEIRESNKPAVNRYAAMKEPK